MGERPIKLTPKDESIYATIKAQTENDGWISPTAMGLAHGRPENQASAWCTNTIRKLMKLGKIEREKGRYRAVKEEGAGDPSTEG